MQKKLIILFLVSFFLSVVNPVYAQQYNSARYPVIPYPTTLKPANGFFIINDQTILVVPKGDLFSNEKMYLKSMLCSYMGANALHEGKYAAKNVIILKYDAAITATEGYALTVKPGVLTLSAKNAAGMFYAIETLRQLLPAAIENGKGKTLAVPAVDIKDHPAFAWRGMQLDVSRHFFSIAYLKKYVDMMALYKLNKLHLHLTDDQGWRIEIKKYPLLTQTGAWRTFNNQDSDCMKMAEKTGNSDFNIDTNHIIKKDGKVLYGGFYTQDEMRSFIKYAAKRHIEIIPEIDMPGHMMAATKIYPYLICGGSPESGIGFSSPICPCDPKVLEFAKDIFSEIIDLFPSKYIHIGGDEVDKTYWEKSQVAQDFARKMGYTDMSQLQGYFNDYMLKFFKSKGKVLVGWDEVVQGGIDSSALVMYWRPWASESPLKAARNHNQVVMTPDGPLYFDAFPDNQTLSSVYNYNPLDSTYHFDKKDESRIIGVQANLWSEMVPSEQRADYMVMPRMTALAELGWAHRYMYDSYLKRLNFQYARLNNLKINYWLPPLTDVLNNYVFVGKTAFFEPVPLPQFTIHYTIDGSQPVLSSQIMNKPVTIDHSLNLKMALFTSSGRRGDIYTLSFAAEQYRPAEAITGTRDGLSCTLFNGQFDSTAMIKGKPDSIFHTNGIAVPAFVKAPAFGLKFQGYINVPETGIYTFALNCNDGGVLRIGGKELINNDGLHGNRLKSAQIALQKGVHSIALDFMEGGGGYLLDLQYGLGNKKMNAIPPSWFKSAL